MQIGKLAFVEDVDNHDALGIPGNVVKDMAAGRVAAHPMIAVQVLRAGSTQVRPLPDEPTRFENLVAVALGLLRSEGLYGAGDDLFERAGGGFGKAESTAKAGALSRTWR